jgi:flagellin
VGSYPERKLKEEHMPLTVNTNIPSLDAQRNVGKNNSALSTSLQRLSSGLRINRAADDAAGLAIATKFDAQVKGLNQAVRNANNAISLVQTAEGGVNTLTDILQRLRELAVQASSDDNTSSDRATTAQEATSLVAEFTRVAGTTQFNTMNLLDGSFTGKYFQIGANYSQKVSFTITDARGKALGARAETTTDIADGVLNAINANFGAGEINVNGAGVAGTSSTDDQYSVLDITSAAIAGSAGAALNGGINIYINGVSVGVAAANLSASVSAATIAANVVAAINGASITGVTARVVNGGTAWVLEGTAGTDLNLAVSAVNGSIMQNVLLSLGLTAVSAMFGSGSAAQAVGNYNGQSSAIAKAVAINAVQTNSGVQATAQSNVATGATAITATTLASGDVYINGYDIGPATVTANDGTGALASAINNQSGNTGVTASVDSNGRLSLTAIDGRNITVTTKDAATATALGLSGVGTNNTYLYRGQLKLNDPNSFSVTANVSLFDLTGAAGTSMSVASSLSTYNVANVKVDTQVNAQAAILTIDAALNQVNNIRAGIGATQNRLQFTVNNLQIASQNMSASESQIKDADFAAEVATFTRNQIMVQAGTAMVAQANSTAQYALQLLR